MTFRTLMSRVRVNVNAAMTVKMRKLFVRLALLGTIVYLLLYLRTLSNPQVHLQAVTDTDDGEDDYAVEDRVDFDDFDDGRLVVENDEQNMRWVYVNKDTIVEKLNVFNGLLIEDLSPNSYWNTSKVFKQQQISFSPEQCSKIWFETIVGSDENSQYKYDSTTRLRFNKIQSYFPRFENASQYDSSDRFQFNNIQTYFLAFRSNRTISVRQQLASDSLLLSTNFHPCVEARSMTDTGGYINTLTGSSSKICRDRCVTDMTSLLSNATIPDYLISADYESVASSIKCNKRSNTWQRDEVRDIVTSVDVVFGASIVHRNGAVYLPSGHQLITHCCNPSMRINERLQFKECDTLKPSGELMFCKEIFVLTQQHAMGNYYHTLIEQLPRALPFVEFLKERPDICLHVPRRSGSTLPEVVLKSFGLNNRIISGHSTARVVYIPHGGGCHQVNLVNTQLLVAASNKFLQQQLNMPDFTRTQPVAILLKRKRRFLVNHDAILNEMSSFCSANSIECIIYDDSDIPSYSDTQALFKRAVVVVGGHGAGLSNIVFCQPGTVVVEIQCDTVARPCFRNLAGKVGLRFITLMSQLDHRNRIAGDQHCNKNGLQANILEISAIFDFITTNYVKLFSIPGSGV